MSEQLPPDPDQLTPDSTDEVQPDADESLNKHLVPDDKLSSDD